MYDITIKVAKLHWKKTVKSKLDILLELHVDLVNVINKRFIDIVHVIKS